MVARIVLEHDGHEVREADNGIDAVRCAIELAPDVILLDIVLPELDGISAAHRIRAHPTAGDTRIVAMTALDRDGISERVLIAGCNAFLLKPFSISTLRDVVREQLALAHAAAPFSVLRDFATYARASIRYRTTKGQLQHP